MTEKKWWHAYGAYSEGYGAFATIVLGPTDGPDDLIKDGSKTFREFTVPLGDEELPWLEAFDHEPSAFEKDQIQPEEYREYNADGSFIEPTTIITEKGDNGVELVTHHKTGDVIQSLLKGDG